MYSVVTSVSVSPTTQVDILISPTEKCNIDDRWRSRAATGERPPSCGPAGGFPAADQRSQYLPGALQPFHHGRTTGRLSQLDPGFLGFCHCTHKEFEGVGAFMQWMKGCFFLIVCFAFYLFFFYLKSCIKSGHEPWKY